MYYLLKETLVASKNKYYSLRCIYKDDSSSHHICFVIQQFPPNAVPLRVQEIWTTVKCYTALKPIPHTQNYI